MLERLRMDVPILVLAWCLWWARAWALLVVERWCIEGRLGVIGWGQKISLGHGEWVLLVMDEGVSQGVKLGSICWRFLLL